MSADIDPVNVELLAGAASIVLFARKLIAANDPTNADKVEQLHDVLFEALAVAGGSLLELSDRLGCEAEVKARIIEGQERVMAYQACQGLGGRA